MLKVTVPATEGFDEKNNTFVDIIPETTLQLEHSLLSLSKWEAKWKKPFLSQSASDPRTAEETIDYIRCMTLNSSVDPEIYNHIPKWVENKFSNLFSQIKGIIVKNENRKENS